MISWRLAALKRVRETHKLAGWELTRRQFNYEWSAASTSGRRASLAGAQILRSSTAKWPTAHLNEHVRRAGETESGRSFYWSSRFQLPPPCFCSAPIQLANSILASLRGEHPTNNNNNKLRAVGSFFSFSLISITHESGVHSKSRIQRRHDSDTWAPLAPAKAI